MPNSESRAGIKPAVALRNLSMTFPGMRDGKSVHVLDRINLEVEEGEFVCIVGPSGCGKSTILNILGGFQKATSGEVIVEGDPVRGPDPRRIFVFQDNAVFPWLTVERNVGFGLLHKTRAERERIIDHYVEMVRLTGFKKAYPRELSGGMRQRVELARALAANPEVLYMDEPFGALDYFTRYKMRADLVKIWQQERKTILFVTHDIDEAVQLADRIVVLGPRPATVQSILSVSLPRPRNLSDPYFLDIRDRILAGIGLALREDAPSSTATVDSSIRNCALRAAEQGAKER